MERAGRRRSRATRAGTRRRTAAPTAPTAPTKPPAAPRPLRQPHDEPVAAQLERGRVRGGEGRRDPSDVGDAPALSFIEIYALNYYSLPSDDDKADAINRLQSMETLHPRLIAFFSKNKHFLWWARAAGVTCSSLVSSDPRVYNLLHFFKHSFNLYLQND